MRKTRLTLAVAALLSLAIGFAGAEDWPSKNIMLQLGYSAGGSSDVMCRLLAKALSDEVGQPVTVINKPGAGGWILWNELCTTMPKDGYTFALINTPGVTTGYYDTANPRQFKHTDCDLLINHVVDYGVIAIRKDEDRFTDFPSFLEYAKKNPMMTAASAIGILSDDYTLMKKLSMAFGLDIECVQTAGAKETETYFLTGDSDIMFANIGDVRPAHEAGDYKVIAVFAPKRSELLPDVPTCEEMGFGKIYNYSARGYAYPKGVPADVRAKMVAALEKAILAMKPQLDKLGAETVILKGKEYVDFLDADVESAKKTYGVDRK